MNGAPVTVAATRRCVALFGALLILCVCLGGAPSAFPQQQQEFTRLQGKVYYKGTSEPYPAAYVRVTVTTERDKRVGRTNSMKEVYTGRDGWFYFTVTPGYYVLEVWSSSRRPVASYKVRAAGPSITLKTIVLP